MALIGNQKKLDKNNNDKLDKEDFKMLGKSSSESPVELGVRVSPRPDYADRTNRQARRLGKLDQKREQGKRGGSDKRRAKLAAKVEAGYASKTNKLDRIQVGKAYIDGSPDLKGGMPMMGKPKEGISMRIKSRLGLGK